MAAPSYVPATEHAPSSYRSPPRRPGAWKADRPGEVIGSGDATGPSLGYQGPDQGYALKLAKRFAEKLKLTPQERADDVLAGCCGVALRRASLFGRAPVVHDLRHALELFGFLDEAPDDLVSWRGPHFEGAANHHGYHIVRHIAELPSELALRVTPAQIAADRDQHWKRMLGLT